MKQPKINHTKNTRKEEIGHGLGGTAVLDGTGGPCQCSAWACLNALNFTVWKKDVFRWESEAILLVLALIMSGKE